MRLTKKKAIDIAIELWTWLAEDGNKNKFGWSEWEEYGEMECDCPLCEYSLRKARSLDEDYCLLCPYYQKYSECYNSNTPYDRWYTADNSDDAQAAAKDFLEELRQL